MDDGDLHEQILRLEVHIEELAEATERCRKIIVMSKAAMAVGGNLEIFQNVNKGNDGGGN